MSTFLITGNTKLFTTDLLKRLSGEHKVVIAGETLISDKERNLYVYHTSPTEEKFSRLFDVYSIDCIWYVSGFVDGGEGLFGENEYIEKLMSECRRSKVEKVIFLSTIESRNYLINYAKNGSVLGKEYSHSRAFRAAQAEEICDYYAERYHLKTIILWLPYIVSEVNDKNFLGKIFWNVYRKEKVTFPYHLEDRLDFIPLNELTDLLIQISEEPDDSSGACFVLSGYKHTYEDLAEMLRMLSSETKIVCENFPFIAELPEYPDDVRRIYGFVPIENVIENIGLYYRRFIRETVNVRHFFGKRLAISLTQAGAGIFQYLELFIVFLMTEVIAHYTSDHIYFKFVDVRLLYIVVMGTMYGMKAGWISALLECIMLVRQYALLGIGGMLLFYNIENWIPFVIYLMTGSITGYIRSKRADEIAFSRKEYTLLREKYLFLNDVYQGAVENKSEYKKQILGFKDSFGKIFDAVQRLDSVLPESIFLEGLGVMENILENHSVAIYTLDSWQKFGRLAVCSSSQLSRLTKSLRIEDYKDMYDAVSRGAVWKNTELEENMPMYACGVFKEDSMVLLITLQEASAEQYGMRYMNIFKILCGLVQTSFLRALEYEKATEDGIYFEGTGIVYPERLRQLLAVQEDMKAAGISDYLLIRFYDKDKKRLSEKLTGLVRANDTIGADENGVLYLLLTQMNRTNYQIVEERLKAQNLEFALTDKVG